MQKLIKKYSEYFDHKSIEMINICFIISMITCLTGLLLLCYYNTYFISISLYEASLVIFRTGLMIGLFPPAFTIIIKKHKNDQNL